MMNVPVTTVRRPRIPPRTPSRIPGVLALLAIPAIWSACGGWLAVPPTPGSATIGPAGGTLFANDGSYVTFPPGALSTATAVTMTPVSNASVPGGGVQGGTAYDFWSFRGSAAVA